MKKTGRPEDIEMVKLRRSTMTKKEEEEEKPGEARRGKGDFQWASEVTEMCVVEANKAKRTKKRKTSNDPIFINLINYIISRPKEFENISANCKHKGWKWLLLQQRRRGEGYNRRAPWACGQPSCGVSVKPAWAAESQNREEGREGDCIKVCHNKVTQNQKAGKMSNGKR